MKIAGLQMCSVVGDIDANLVRIEKAAERAAGEGARLLITPELALTGYGAADHFPALASPADGWLTGRLSEMAHRHGLTIVTGFAEKDGENIYNSALLTDGANNAIYRKSHLYGPYEKQWFRPEKPNTVLVTMGEVKLGMLICYDVEFPENMRRLAQADADLIVVPTALPEGSSGRFIAEHMIRVRAFENQVFVAYINHCGADEHFVYAGRSCIAAPDGSLLAQVSQNEEGLLFADVNIGAFAQSRAENTYLSDLS